MGPIFYSDAESRRTGLNIYRAKLEVLDIPKLKEEIVRDKVDVLILRIPTETKSTHKDLLRLGFPVIHADSLLYYYNHLQTYPINELRNKLDFIEVDEGGMLQLKELVRKIFANYQNHYTSNFFFSNEVLIEGYIEWMESFIKSRDKIIWFVEYEGKKIGFAACSFNVLKKTCEGVLYGVIGNYSGKGVYSDMIRFTQKYFKNMGCYQMWVSTQLQNYSVQKAWIKEGFLLRKSLETYHINSLLSHPHIGDNLRK